MSDRMEQGKLEELAGGVLTLCLTMTDAAEEPSRRPIMGSDQMHCPR